MNITSQEKLDLKRLITEFDSEDNTEHIRQLKHSSLLYSDIQSLSNYLADHEDASMEDAQTSCQFLYRNYPDIFAKMFRKELNLTIMEKFLNVLRQIEDGEFNQHEGSVIIGKILKELYLDSAIRRGENLDQLYEKDKIQPVVGKTISWSEYKRTKL